MKRRFPFRALPVVLGTLTVCSSLPALHAEENPMKIELGEEVVVATSEPNYPHWGPYQFPRLNRMPDGSILISYHLEEDSITAYGLPKGMAVSSDDGKTWKVLPKPEDPSEQGNFKESVLLPNGDYIKPFAPRSIPGTELTLPEKPIFEGLNAYGQEMKIYQQADIPELQGKGWQLFRLPKGEAEWVLEQANVDLPGLVGSLRQGVYPVPRFDVLKMAPDGSIWSLEYRLQRFVDGKLTPRSILILRSTDNGKNWNLWSSVPYQPDSSTDPIAEQRVGGYTEPDVTFLPDGTALMLLRTTDGKGPGPLYAVRSTDMGKTWSKPVLFDDLGVWPQLLTLGNGATLATYGRPGFYLRATSDPSANRWEERMTIIPPREIHSETCSYSALLPLDENTALLAYSDFHHKTEDGKRRKAIIVRKVTATR